MVTAEVAHTDSNATTLTFYAFPSKHHALHHPKFRHWLLATESHRASNCLPAQDLRWDMSCEDCIEDFSGKNRGVWGFGGVCMLARFPFEA